MLYALQRSKHGRVRVSSRRRHLSWDDFLYGSVCPDVLLRVRPSLESYTVDLLEPSSPVCKGVHLNRNDSRCISARWSPIRITGERERKGERRGRKRERERGKYPTGVVTWSTTVSFITRNIISQSYWPIRTSCLHEIPARFSFTCPTALHCFLLQFLCVCVCVYLSLSLLVLFNGTDESLLMLRFTIPYFLWSVLFCTQHRAYHW